MNAITGKCLRSNQWEWAVDAEIIDINRRGIKVRLKTALARDNIGLVKVTMRLPESGVPFSLHGILEQLPNGAGSGNRDFDYLKVSIDDMRFECVKLDHSTLLIKTYIS